MTHVPVIDVDTLDLFFNGETIYNKKGCIIDADPMKFVPNSNFTSQLVISESALACMLEHFSASEIGRVDLDKNTINRLWGTDNLKFNSTELAAHFPIF